VKFRLFFTLLIICFNSDFSAQLILDKTSTNGDIIYYDDFSFDKGLVVNNDGNSYGQPHYRYFELNCSSSTSIGILPVNKTIDQNKDFQIEATIKFVSGQDNNGNGIIWGKSNYTWNNFFSFSFTGNGKSYAIGKKANNVWENSIVPWKSTSYLKKSENNKLTIRKAGEKYFFFINENLVHQCAFESFYGDENCLFVNSNSTVHISNITLTYFKGNTKNNDVENFNSTSTTYRPSVGVSQNSNVTLDKIEINKKYTVVTMTYKTATDNSQFWFNKEAYIRTNKKNYYLEKSDIGFTQYDCNFLKNKGQSKTFNLYFNRIDEGIENIDILEEISNTLAFNFLGVKINNPLKDNSNIEKNSSQSDNPFSSGGTGGSGNSSSISNNNKFESLRESDFIFNEIIPGVQFISSEEEWLNLSPNKACCCYPDFNEKNKSLGLLFNKLAFDKVKIYLLNSRKTICSSEEWKDLFAKIKKDPKKIEDFELNIYPGYFDEDWYSPEANFAGYWMDENTMVSFSNDSYGEPMVDESIYNDGDSKRQSLVALAIRISKSSNNTCETENWLKENINSRGSKNQIKFISKLSDWNTYSPKQACCCYINFDLNNDSFGFLYNLKAYELLKNDQSLKDQGFRVASENDWKSILECLNNNGGIKNIFNCEGGDVSSLNIMPNGSYDSGSWTMPEKGICNYWISDNNNSRVVELNCADKNFRYVTPFETTETSNKRNYSAFMIRFIKL
jgi:hypothetical protein